MVYKRESLEKLLDLIKEICSDEENKWFREKLISDLLDSKTKSVDFREYFLLLKKQLRLKGNHLYKDIKDAELKRQLLDDYVKMNWYQINNDMKLAIVYAFFQMENMLNYYIQKSNAYHKIESKKEFYKYSPNEKFDVNCYKNFFDGKHKKEVNNITIWPKIIYWACDENKIDYIRNHTSTFSNLIKVRNEENHRNTMRASETQNTIDYLKNGDFSEFSFYTNILKTIYKSCIKIDGKIVEKGNINEMNKPKKGLTVVGKIDLSKIPKK